MKKLALAIGFGAYIVFGASGVGVCAGPVFLVSRALAEVRRMAAISQTMTKDIRCFRLIKCTPVSLRSEPAMTTPFPAAKPSALSTTGHPNSPARITCSASSSESDV